MKIYSVFMRGGDGAFVEVQRSLIKGMRGTSSYSYHMALLLKLGSNYFVLDPVVLGSAKLAKPSEWLRNFTMKSPISVEIFKVDSKK